MLIFLFYTVVSVTNGRFFHGCPALLGLHPAMLTHPASGVVKSVLLLFSVSNKFDADFFYFFLKKILDKYFFCIIL